MLPIHIATAVMMPSRAIKAIAAAFDNSVALNQRTGAAVRARHSTSGSAARMSAGGITDIADQSMAPGGRSNNSTAVGATWRMLV